MANEKQNPNTEEEIDRSGIDFRSDADTSINSAALSQQDTSSDEESLVEAMGQNAFVLFFTRLLIKVKNHIAIIPMILIVITMMIITFTIQVHVNATVNLSNDKFNSFWFFINVVLSLMAVLLYLNIQNRKIEKKKWIIFMVLLYLVLGGEMIIDLLYMRDIRIETSLYNSINLVVEKEDRQFIEPSYAYTMVHFVFLIIDAIAAALAPILQPFAKKIQIRRKKKSN